MAEAGADTLYSHCRESMCTDAALQHKGTFEWALFSLNIRIFDSNIADRQCVSPRRIVPAVSLRKKIQDTGDLLASSHLPKD